MPRQLLFVWIPGAIVLLGGCTPFGLWMYEDPRIAVSRVSVARLHAGDSVRVALAVDNRNDYTVEATRVEVALRVDGMAIGSLAYDTLVPLPEEVTSLVAVPLRLGTASSDGRLRRIAPGTHQYHVEGRAEFRTPIGIRHVAFQEEGAMTFGLAARRE